MMSRGFDAIKWLLTILKRAITWFRQAGINPCEVTSLMAMIFAIFSNELGKSQ